MTGLFNDRYYLNLILAVLFVLGIGVSLYFIYSLPADLRLIDGFQSQFIEVYLTLGLTFTLGISAILAALRYRKEMIVFRDRVLDTEKSEREHSEAGKTTISLESVKQNLAKAQGGTKDLLQ